MLNLIRRIRRQTKAIRDFEHQLATNTPLIEGHETRRVARAIGYDPTRARQLIAGEVEFGAGENRATYPDRALEWARSSAANGAGGGQ